MITHPSSKSENSHVLYMCFYFEGAASGSAALSSREAPRSVIKPLWSPCADDATLAYVVFLIAGVPQIAAELRYCEVGIDSGTTDAE